MSVFVLVLALKFVGRKDSEVQMHEDHGRLHDDEDTEHDEGDHEDLEHATDLFEKDSS